jgi:hypothetical protein
MGSLYLRGKVWWIKYYRGGKRYRESANSTKKMVAQKLLERREGDIAQGKMSYVNYAKVTFDELKDDFLRDYRINNKKSIDRAEISASHLERFFGGWKAIAITSTNINTYIEKRMDEGVDGSTINRELSALKRMMNLGAMQTPPKVDRIPCIPKLKENNIRKGFFEYDDFVRVRELLPAHLKPVVTFAYKTRVENL